MKLHEQVREVSTSGHKSNSDFRIATSAKAFRILSDGIYSDKVKAIIRELSTNANDSHTEAGTEKPFDVHLPMRSEPWFSVRDYGTGMSKEKIEDLYTTYFDSDRNTSNDFTGALGLGSKSPFSYTDNFTVESYYNGKKYTYSCYIDETGTPKVSLLLETETENENGVEVKFSVSENDFNEFAKKAGSVFYSFKTKPNLTGTQIDFYERKVLHSGEDWELVQKDFRNRSAGAFALMGNVAYPIDTTPFIEKLSNEEAALLENSSCDIYFELGELDVSASRESLSYDMSTIKNIKMKASKIVNEIYERTKKEANKANNYWEAIAAVNRYKKTFGGCANLSSIVPKVMFKSSEILIDRRFNFNLDESLSVDSYQRGWNGQINKRFESRVLRFNFGDIPLVIVNDEKNGTCVRKSRYFLKNTDFYHILYVIKEEDWNKKYQREWKNIHVKYSSELPKPVYKRKKRTEVQKNFLDITGGSNFSFIAKDEIDFEGSHFYVEVKNNRFIYNEMEINIKKYLEFVRVFNLLGDRKVYGVKTSETKRKIFRESNFVSLCEFVENETASFVEENIEMFQKLYEYRANRRHLRSWGSFFSDNTSEKINSEIYSEVFSEFKEMTKKGEELSESMEKLSILMSFSQIQASEDVKDLSRYVDKFVEEYPLLKKIPDFSWTDDSVIEYINAVEMMRNK